MAKFRFRLDAVLRVRKSREEAALRGLGDAQRAYQAEIARKTGIQRELEQSLLRREGFGQEPTGILTFQLEQSFITGTKQRIVQADQAIVRAGRSVEKALRTYLGAKRQSRVIEMLHEKAYAEWRKAQARKEQKELEDLTVMRTRFKPDFFGGAA